VTSGYRPHLQEGCKCCSINDDCPVHGFSSPAERERIELLQRDVTLERCASICEEQIAADEAHGRMQSRSILSRTAASIRALKAGS